MSFEQAASIATGFNPFAVATYAQQPQGLALTPPFEEGGLGKYANQPIVIMGGASSLGQYGTFARQHLIRAFVPIRTQPSNLRSCPVSRPSSRQRRFTTKTFSSRLAQHMFSIERFLVPL